MKFEIIGSLFFKAAHVWNLKSALSSRSIRSTMATALGVSFTGLNPASTYPFPDARTMQLSCRLSWKGSLKTVVGAGRSLSKSWFWSVTGRFDDNRLRAFFLALFLFHE